MKVPSGLGRTLSNRGHTGKRVLGVALACCMTTAIITLFIPNQYTSEAKILPVEPKAGAGLNQWATAAAARGLSMGQESPDGTYPAIVMSRWVGDQLTRKRYSYSLPKGLFHPPVSVEGTLAAYLKATNADDAATRLAKILTCNRDLKTKILTIRVETQSPALSQQVAQEAITLLGRFLREKTNVRGSEKASFAENRLEEARTAYAKAEADFRTFLDSNRNFTVTPDPAIRLKGMRLEGELKLRQQVIVTLTVALEQAVLEAKDNVSIFSVLDFPQAPLRKSWPPRAMLVLLAGICGAAACLVALNRKWVWRHFIVGAGGP